MTQDMRTIWARLGISLRVTQQEADLLINGTHQTKAAVLSRIFSDGRAVIDGDSYIPSNIIAEFNLQHGTNYSRMEVDLNTEQLDGKAIRTASARHKSRGDTR